MNPNSGPTESAVAIRLDGAGFKPGARVMLGDSPATNVVVVGDRTITATAPAHAAGEMAVTVTVTNPDGESARKVDGYAYVLVAISAIDPAAASAGTLVRITGTGFLSGATVTMGGVAATVTSVSPNTILVTAPNHDLGPADVVVRNPGGQSGRRDGGFTYEPPPSVTASPDTVTAGGEIAVSWVNSNPATHFDWIGMFRVGAPNQAYGEYAYTDRRTTGTVVFRAPAAPGVYEFRYLLDDGFVDIARSNPITVTGGAR